MRERLRAPQFQRVFGKVRQQVLNTVRREWSAFSQADMSDPSLADVEAYLKPNEGRNIQWGVTSLSAVLDQDIALKEMMKRVIVNYGHIILASKRFADEGHQSDSLRPWKNPAFDVAVSWTFGASGYALAFDVLYNDMRESERAVVVKAIATATRGRKSYGMGKPRGFASSNHYGYHGDLAAMLSVIEDEPGFDHDTWMSIVQVLRDYWEVGFTPLGYPREDGYGPNLGMRAGSRGALALARRGLNIFATPKYRNFINFLAQDFDPYPGGHLNGGASGGPYEELYPTSTLVARYMYPENGAANFALRQLMGETYERRVRWQGWLDFMMFGTDWVGAKDRDAMMADLGLPLSVFYPVRGKFIARSDWSSDAMYLTFDARPDAQAIGHDKVDRGNFSLSALGRVWAFSGDWSKWNLSLENSLVHIDGKAQAWKAPSVRFLWHDDDRMIAGAGADLKYAYDWQWTPPWPKWGKSFQAPWQPETNSPVDLGFPNGLPEFSVPIHGSQTGYGGRNNLHRRPYNPVQKALRSAFIVRGDHPFALVCDDIRKDDSAHSYEWVMQLPLDLVMESSGNNQVLLNETRGDRRCLVRFLQEQHCRMRIEEYEAHTSSRSGVTQGKRLIATMDAVEPRFKVLLYPHRRGDQLPGTTWNAGQDVMKVRWGRDEVVLKFASSDGAGVKVSR